MSQRERGARQAQQLAHRLQPSLSLPFLSHQGVASLFYSRRASFWQWLLIVAAAAVHSFSFPCDPRSSLSRLRLAAGVRSSA